MYVDTIWLNYSGSQAINLVDSATDVPLGATPEWTSGGRNVPAAYVRNTSSIVLAVTFGDTGNGDEVRVRAPSGVLNDRTWVKDTTATFDVGTLSLPDSIGVNRIPLTWEIWVPDGKDDGSWDFLSSMTLTIYTTWAAMVPNTGEGLTSSVYTELVQWTCTWAAGLDDTKAICDAVISNLPKSGLKYQPGAYDIRAMLLNGGGMCGGWGKMYQYMVHCQGIYVYRRAFLVDWRSLPNNEVQWAAIVCTAGGLNQIAPPVPSEEFNDNDTHFPSDAEVPLTVRTERRWIFWGRAGGVLDGHVVNMLTIGSNLYLYDPSFGAGPFPIAMRLPPTDGTILGGTQLSSFKSVYLNTAVPYMMGSLFNGDAFYNAYAASQRGPIGTGITVSTPIIPDVVSGLAEITFAWYQG